MYPTPWPKVSSLSTFSEKVRPMLPEPVMGSKVHSTLTLVSGADSQLLSGCILFACLTYTMTSSGEPWAVAVLSPLVWREEP